MKTNILRVAFSVSLMMCQLVNPVGATENSNSTTPDIVQTTSSVLEQIPLGSQFGVITDTRGEPITNARVELRPIISSHRKKGSSNQRITSKEILNIETTSFYNNEIDKSWCKYKVQYMHNDKENSGLGDATSAYYELGSVTNTIAVLTSSPYTLKVTGNKSANVELNTSSITPIHEVETKLTAIATPKYLVEISKEGQPYRFKVINAPEVKEKIFSGTEPFLFAASEGTCFMIQDVDNPKRVYTVGSITTARTRLDLTTGKVTTSDKPIDNNSDLANISVNQGIKHPETESRSNPEVLITQTNAKGEYIFKNVSLGNYTVVVFIPDTDQRIEKINKIVYKDATIISKVIESNPVKEVDQEVSITQEINNVRFDVNLIGSSNPIPILVGLAGAASLLLILFNRFYYNVIIYSDDGRLLGKRRIRNLSATIPLNLTVEASKTTKSLIKIKLNNSLLERLKLSGSILKVMIDREEVATINNFSSNEFTLERPIH